MLFSIRANSTVPLVHSGLKRRHPWPASPSPFLSWNWLPPLGRSPVPYPSPPRVHHGVLSFFSYWDAASGFPPSSGSRLRIWAQAALASLPRAAALSPWPLVGGIWGAECGLTPSLCTWFSLHTATDVDTGAGRRSKPVSDSRVRPPPLHTLPELGVSAAAQTFLK